MVYSGLDFSNFFEFDIAPEVYSSLIVMLIICILSVIIGIKARMQDPLKKPKGLLHIAEIGVSYFENFVVDLIGPRFRGFGGYIMAVAIYLFISFIFGLTGLPSPITYFAIPLSLAFLTFFLIHATAVKYQKWSYFKRYVDPFPVFLPINLVSMWAPLISLSLRLFGNAISGWTLMTLIYLALESVSASIFTAVAEGLNSVFLAPLVTWILHLYFDLFSALIQTVVFISLTTIYVGQEGPEDVIE